MKDKKMLPIGYDLFHSVRGENFYYVDKSLFIKELLDSRAGVSLFTRPRRFGKSLNMSMLQYFFENLKKGDAHYFDGLAIMEAGEEYLAHMNRYPVIAMTLKDAAYSDFQTAARIFRDLIADEFQRHIYVLDGGALSAKDIEKYRELASGKQDLDSYTESLRFLSICLHKHYGERALILIDEYDVPLEKAYFQGYYEEMVNFIRSFFSSALKSNPSLDFAVMTGCLRISRESIFTGLNNLRVVSITAEQYGEYFGFTEAEVFDMLHYYGLDDKRKEAHDWYNGYVFGEANVYNPWSVINYVDSLRHNRNRAPDPHWSNTSHNSIIRELVEIAGKQEKEEIENLIRGGTITKPIHEDIAYGEIKDEMDNMWNFLFFTGYLKKVSEEQSDGEQKILTMAIPNIEVRYIYRRKINEWFNKKIELKDPTRLLAAILTGDADTITDEMNKRLLDVISFHDSAENFYHGFLLGILSGLGQYSVKSNRESGHGRSDICLKSTGIARKAVIFECKALKDKDDPIAVCQAAIRQIGEKGYDHELAEEGYKEIMKYAVVFRGKECLVYAEECASYITPSASTTKFKTNSAVEP